MAQMMQQLAEQQAKQFNSSLASQISAFAQETEQRAQATTKQVESAILDLANRTKAELGSVIQIVDAKLQHATQPPQPQPQAPMVDLSSPAQRSSAAGGCVEGMIPPPRTPQMQRAATTPPNSATMFSGCLRRRVRQ